MYIHKCTCVYVSNVYKFVQLHNLNYLFFASVYDWVVVSCAKTNNESNILQLGVTLITLRIMHINICICTKRTTHQYLHTYLHKLRDPIMIPIAIVGTFVCST